MILMNLELENIICFNDFKMNLAYPKKIVNSRLEYEHLNNFPNFRYRKINIIYGANSTGKTSLARVIMYIVNLISNKNIGNLNNLKGIGPNSYFLIDFVVEETIYRVESLIEDEDYKINVQMHRLLKLDTYEKAISYFTRKEFINTNRNIEALDNINVNLGWLFSFTEDVFNQPFMVYSQKEIREKQLKILKTILMVLDSNIKDVKSLNYGDNKEIEDAYAIELHSGKIVLCQNGKQVDSNILSSGTRTAFNLANSLTSMLFNLNQFYYLDEQFSYLNTEFEKTIISLIVEYISKKEEQVFITTHNLDISELNLPKHSFWFLRKESIEDKQADIKILSASDLIIKNNVNLRNAIENDVFNTTPKLEKIDDLENLLVDTI